MGESLGHVYRDMCEHSMLWHVLCAMLVTVCVCVRVCTRGRSGSNECLCVGGLQVFAHVEGGGGLCVCLRTSRCRRVQAGWNGRVYRAAHRGSSCPVARTTSILRNNRNTLQNIELSEKRKQLRAEPPVIPTWRRGRRARLFYPLRFM